MDILLCIDSALFFRWSESCQDGKQSLVVRNIGPNDLGSYRCTIINKLGRDSSLGLLRYRKASISDVSDPGGKFYRKGTRHTCLVARAGLEGRHTPGVYRKSCLLKTERSAATARSAKQHGASRKTSPWSPKC